MIVITGTVRLPAANREAAFPAMRAMVEASRAEDGCEAYSYAFDLLDDGLVHIVERWREREALEAHFATAHMAEWRAQFAKLGITDRDLTLFETDAGAPV